jgi:hypothetical protein
MRCFFTPEDLLYHFELHVDLIPLRSVCFDQFLSDIEGLWRLQLDELNAEADQCQRDAFAERLSVLGVPYARPGMHELDLHTLFYRFDVEPELWPTKESASYLGEPPQISIRGR